MYFSAIPLFNSLLKISDQGFRKSRDFFHKQMTLFQVTSVNKVNTYVSKTVQNKFIKTTFLKGLLLY